MRSSFRKTNPIIDNNSTWQGARGVCRDITEIREREASFRRIRKSEHILKKIISTIRDEVDPSRILDTTASVALDGITAKHCYVARIFKNDKRSYNIELKAESGNLTKSPVFDKLATKTLEICNNSKNNIPPSYVEENINGNLVLIGFSEHHNEINGALIIVIDEEKKTWNKDEKSLFIGVTSHLGIAFEQIKNYEKLERLSNTDELSSLLNRRAFTQKVNKRLIIQKRQQHTCALLFIDLDNFKQVNDTFGHAAGDDVLQKLSNILTINTRTEDYCCRLGGDEFAVWLENVDEDKAILQAKRILKCTNELRKGVTNKTAPLSLSIGIALSTPKASLSLDDLMELADKALYDVKKNGKSNVLLNQNKDF